MKIRPPSLALFLFLAATLLFWLWPGLDLAVSGFFYENERGFYLADAAAVTLLYRFSPWLTNAAQAALWAALIASFWSRWRRWRRPALYLLAVLWLGPGFAVTVLKDHWDRARPNQIIEFGGDKRFTPAWVVSDQCKENCAFVSGHASGAFAWMALAWVFPRHRRRWLMAGISWGSVVGIARMAQGGHFLSDVVFAGFVVYFTADLLARALLRDVAKRRSLVIGDETCDFPQRRDAGGQRERRQGFDSREFLGKPRRLEMTDKEGASEGGVREIGG